MVSKILAKISRINVRGSRIVVSSGFIRLVAVIYAMSKIADVVMRQPMSSNESKLLRCFQKIVTRPQMMYAPKPRVMPDWGKRRDALCCVAAAFGVIT